MQQNKKGFSVVEILILIVVLALIGFVGWRVYNSKQNTYDSENLTTQQEESATNQSDESDLPDGWVRYTNNDFGFSFGYPSEWGDVMVGEVHYGSEQQAGPRRSLTFTDCDDCNPDKAIPLGAPTPEIGINSKDFGGIGTSRPLAIDAGYKKNSVGSYTVYKTANKETIYTDDNTLELSVINNLLFIRQNDSFHNLDTTRAVVNLTDGGEYSGISFIIHDEVGETTNAELLRSIVETFETK